MHIDFSAYSSLVPPGLSPTGPAAAQAGSPDERKLRHAAAEFEAMLLSKWWSAMKDSGLPGSDDDSDPGRDTLDQLGMQTMSTAVAAGGGIGIGSLLVHSLLSNVPAAEPAGKLPMPKGGAVTQNNSVT